MQHTWSPQDLTKDSPGFSPIPEDDYVKQYQRRPELWPVEFFLIAYRRTQDKGTQILVRKSANGTSKYGVGTGVPATRWVLSTQERPPFGYRWSEPDSTSRAAAAQEPARITFAASNFPEFSHQDAQPSWAYSKIDLRANAFNGPESPELDPELEEYAGLIRTGLRAKLAEGMHRASSWEASQLATVQRVLDDVSSRAAIQGSLRMSGLFARKTTGAAQDETPPPRYVDLGHDAPDPSELVQSVRIFTMFPQMPEPMPLPSTPPEELQREIAARDAFMAESGRDAHRDKHGRTFTHKSTSNVSNTIHGVYLTLDATGRPGLEEVPAFDLFGSAELEREWKSLQDLKVLDSDGASLSSEDPKPTFISGFIVRQLVKEGVIVNII